MIILFTDFIDDNEMKYNLGWVLVSLILLIISANMSVVIFETIKSLFTTLKALYRKYKAKRMNKNRDRLDAE